MSDTSEVQRLEAKGITGTLGFDGRMVYLNRSGAVARITHGKGEKRIPVSAITSLEWKPAGLVRGLASSPFRVVLKRPASSVIARRMPLRTKTRSCSRRARCHNSRSFDQLSKL